ncbi:hypothetical protein LOCC1_G004429 [Lachnellula occidentalis]|uniref:Uncharacterized protein n=1 Tax=Lachnellula occidentalis TaxID=215460 RepID=A0A8H8RY87_9HELO|nr:hypothetical protein LOCC1_G004429 [Lachnellula occidentalis]
MANYPTPPPTSSPKDYDHDRNYNHNVHHDTYHSYSPPTFPLPAQESYYYAPPPQSTRINTNQNPKPYNNQKPTPYNSNNPTTRPQKRCTPPPRPPPRPIYFSPTNKPPSPYSTARPKPRPGFVKRIKAKIEEWVRALITWAKENPVKAGLAAFVPLVAVAGVAKAVHGLVAIGGELLGRKMDEHEGGKAGDEEEEDGKEERGEEKEKPKKVYGWGLDHFVGFGGSKGGPMEGMLKILQMFM